MVAVQNKVKLAAILTSRDTMCTRIIWINLSMIPHGHSHHHSKWSCHSKAARLLQRRTMRLLLSRIIKDNNQITRMILRDRRTMVINQTIKAVRMNMVKTLITKNTKKSRMVKIINKKKILISWRLSMIQCCNAIMIQTLNHIMSSSRIEKRLAFKMWT